LQPQQVREPLDDAGLAHKVESVLFRDTHVPKGEISINAERGTVFLRGQVESPELIDELTKSVRKIVGVSEVVNLLHLPGTPAPHPGAARLR
jgi:osmotically-inducible protein OsmY